MQPPKIENAPGLKWRPIKHGWQALWRARGDVVKRGYGVRQLRLWSSTAKVKLPDMYALIFISERCQEYQADMLAWAHGGIEEIATYDKTWAGLVYAYQHDPDSTYHEKRYATRDYYDTLCRRIVKDCGSEKIADTDARRLKRLHEGWSAKGKVAMGHSMIGMMRTITTFGATMLRCQDCRTIRSDLRDMRVKASKPREDHLSAEQATAIRRQAHTMGRRSIALAQAFQFDLTLRQKDSIGEWVPLNEPGPLSDTISGNEKWVRGLRGEEIDQNMILRHVTSKREKMLVVDLHYAPMVIEELKLAAGLGPDDQLQRHHIQASGPLIVSEATGRPWKSGHFRLTWRTIARAAGVPDHVKNMDTRSGAITEALSAGAPMDAVRKSATHSNASMTQRYSRGDEQAVAQVMQIRSAHRKKPT